MMVLGGRTVPLSLGMSTTREIRGCPVKAKVICIAFI